jgi:riboflavin transporter FmnP
MEFRTDSKSISVLAIFSSIVIALEVFPINGITDLKFFPGGTPFTLDWTGIPIIVVFLALGMISSVITIGIMCIAIGYRNPIGSIFKGAAELFTIIGILAAKFIADRKSLNEKQNVLLYLVFGVLARSIGMFFVNIPLLPIFYPLFYTTESAIIASTILVPWNAVQAVINIVGGLFLYQLIPESIRIQAGLGEHGKSEIKYEELSEEELNAESELSDENEEN